LKNIFNGQQHKCAKSDYQEMFNIQVFSYLSYFLWCWHNLGCHYYNNSSFGAERTTTVASRAERTTTSATAIASNTTTLETASNTTATQE
jgi:hypothetical protein